MRINNNVAAFNAYRNLSVSQNQLGKSLEKLSSGFRINRAADDASGLVISENLRAQIGGLRQASRNAQDGVSVVQTAEGALTEVHSMLQRMRDLAVQVASTGTYGDDAKTAAQAEFDQLAEEITRISTSTKFGDKVLFDGSLVKAGAVSEVKAKTSVTVTPDPDPSVATQTVTVTVGSTDYTVDVDPNDDASTMAGKLAAAVDGSGNRLDSVATVTGVGTTLTVESLAGADGETIALAIGAPSAGTDAATFAPTGTDLTGVAAVAEKKGAVFQVGAFEGDTIAVGINSLSISTLGSDTLKLNAITDLTATGVIDAIDAAIGQVSTQRGDLGAVQNRFEHTVANLQVAVENLTASESRIRDTDMALEMTTFTRNQIMQQAGTAMLAQANTLPQSVLQLLR